MSYVRYEIGLVLVYNLQQNKIHVKNCFRLVCDDDNGDIISHFSRTVVKYRVN